MANLYIVDFEIVNIGPTNKAAPKYLYRAGRRQGLVLAANTGAIQGVLNADIAVGSGETVEILHVQQAVSREGQTVYS
jgi:hypothetical protein